MSANNIVKNTTCFVEHKKRNLKCQKESCRNWMNCPSALNCAIIGGEQGKWILKDIGEIFDVTRMRICQIEKEIIKKLGTECRDKV